MFKSSINLIGIANAIVLGEDNFANVTAGRTGQCPPGEPHGFPGCPPNTEGKCAYNIRSLSDYEECDPTTKTCAAYLINEKCCENGVPGCYQTAEGKCYTRDGPCTPGQDGCMAGLSASNTCCRLGWPGCGYMLETTQYGSQYPVCANQWGEPNVLSSWSAGCLCDENGRCTAPIKSMVAVPAANHFSGGDGGGAGGQSGGGAGSQSGGGACPLSGVAVVSTACTMPGSGRTCSEQNSHTAANNLQCNPASNKCECCLPSDYIQCTEFDADCNPTKCACSATYVQMPLACPQAHTN